MTASQTALSRPVRSLNHVDRAVERTLRGAVERGAHDIYVSPLPEGGYRIELGIDGQVVPGFRVPRPERARSFFSQLKALSGCDLQKQGVPQEAGFSLRDPAVDLRASILPTLHGEHLTLRVLRARTFGLRDYPMPWDAKDALRAALKRGQGLIVLSGPTGTGKTTLLHHAIATLNDGSRAIYTIEDPIEYVVAGLHQLEVNEAHPPAALLRAVLRHAPHALAVGEVRDPDTARLVIEAVRTGHLVLTTVHAGTMADLGPRFERLGVPPDELRAHLAFASSQRLVRALCDDCWVADYPAAQRLRDDHGVTSRAFRCRGCATCDHTGVQGRVLLMGWMDAHGSRTLRDAAIEAADSGVVDADTALSCL